METFITFIISLIASLVAVLVVLWIERIRMPKLVIHTGDSVNDDITYKGHRLHSGERWKFFRIAVKNKKIPKPFSWIPRQTAQNCRGKLEFYKKGESSLIFSFIGRWSSTPEIPHIPHEAIVKLQQPDPVTISVEEKEIMDIFVKAEVDDVAYGWNNESYIYDWRNKKFTLENGEYVVKITISTQNGISFKKNIEIAIRKTIEDTIIKSI